MTTLKEFMEICSRTDEAYVIEEGTLFIWKNKCIKVIKVQRPMVEKMGDGYNVKL